MDVTKDFLRRLYNTYIVNETEAMKFAAAAVQKPTFLDVPTSKPELVMKFYNYSFRALKKLL